ncbi:MAG TPA: threonine synthase, partial [Verrucomicrobiae bacterium]
QMMARMFGRFLREDGKQVTILTATSGDTGAAVAHAFHNVPGIRVIVLFPIDEVSMSQRKLMTTLTGNIRTLAIDGKFDDCQAMVKQAFADAALKHIPLSSANSINIGRLLPQSIYYFYAASRLAKPGEPIVFSVPSGNFGDMMGAVVARQMGLPIRKLVVPVNDNDAFPKFLASGIYEKIVPSRNSVSNAMNVGHPSNLSRLVAVYGGQMDETGKINQMPDVAAMRRDLFSSSISDQRTRETIREVWNKYGLLLEAHGAVAWRGFEDWLETESLNNLPAVILETANPAKFPEEIEKTIGFAPDVPENMLAALKLPEDFDRLGADYEKFREYLISNHAA